MPSHVEKEIGHIENKIYYLYDRGMKFLYQLSTLRLANKSSVSDIEGDVLGNAIFLLGEAWCSGSYFAAGLNRDLANSHQASLKIIRQAEKGVLRMAIARSKAEGGFAQIRKREQGLNQEADAAARERADKTARLRQLRLAKEAEDVAEKQAAKDIKAAGKGVFKR